MGHVYPLGSHVMSAADVATVAAAAFKAETGNVSVAQVAQAVAIARPESGFDSGVVNDTPATGDLSYGLWQINLYGPLIGRLKEYGLTDANALLSPAVNAKAMVKISGGGTHWGDWSTYNRGTAHVTDADTQAANLAILNLGINSGGGPVGGGIPSPSDLVPANPLDALAGIADTLKSFGAFFAKLLDPAFWKRVGLGVLGVAVIVAGVVILNRKLLAQAGEVAAIA